MTGLSEQLIRKWENLLSYRKARKIGKWLSRLLSRRRNYIVGIEKITETKRFHQKRCTNHLRKYKSSGYKGAAALGRVQPLCEQ